MSSVDSIGFSPIVWLEALFKRITDGVGGRGGLEAFVMYFDQIDFIRELTPLLMEMKANNIFFETALSQCNKELLKRPRKLREREIFWLMGCKCNKCGKQVTFWAASDMGEQCDCPAQGEYESLYAEVLNHLLEEHISATPEAVLMSLAYDHLADAYINAYKALRLVMDKTAEMFNWANFRIEDPQLRNYLDQLFFGRLTGETKIPREEKETLQLIIRAGIADVSIELVEPFIRKAMCIVKYGYLYEVLTCTGAKNMYIQVAAECGPLYNRINKQIRETLRDSYATAKRRTVHISTKGGNAPCLQVARHCWESGKISNTVTLDPLYRFPIFPKSDFGALQLVYARIGAGKTFLLSKIANYAVDSKSEIVFSPLNDKSQSFSFACMPLFEYDKRTTDLVNFLKENLDVEPHGIPTLTLTVLRKDEKTKLDHQRNPPTIYDRVLEVEEPRGFKVNFNDIVDELKEIASDYGYAKPLGMVCVRNLDRLDPLSNTNVDVQIAMNLLIQFDAWRKSNLGQRARIVIDELSYSAPSQVILYAGDASRSGAAISDVIKESRRSRTSVDAATQLPLEILPEIRNASTNVFWRDLAVSKDRSRSQIEFVLESLQLEDPSIRGVVKDINNRGLLPKGYWFWYHQPARAIEVIRPSPPTFCLQDVQRTPLQLYKLYEKKTGQKILLKGWSEVREISVERSSRVETKRDSNRLR
jgi:hypothetical protein